MFQWRDWGVRGLVSLGVVLALGTYLFMLQERQEQWRHDSAAVFNDQVTHLAQAWHKKIDVLEDLAAYYKAAGEFTQDSFVRFHHELLDQRAHDTQSYYLDYAEGQWRVIYSNLPYAVEPGLLNEILLQYKPALERAQATDEPLMILPAAQPEHIWVLQPTHAPQHMLLGVFSLEDFIGRHLQPGFKRQMSLHIHDGQKLVFSYEEHSHFRHTSSWLLQRFIPIAERVWTLEALPRVVPAWWWFHAWPLLMALVAFIAAGIVPAYVQSLRLKALGHNQALKLAKDEAVQAHKIKAEFLAVMSHEIRTPLNGVLGMLTLLLDTPLTEQPKHFATTAKHCAENLLELINDILDFSKLEARRMPLEKHEFSIEELVQSLDYMLRPKAEAKNLTMTVSLPGGLPALVCGDESRLRQLLTNLLGNAIKFTPQGFVRLQVSKLQEWPGQMMLRFEVVDSGVGVAASKQAGLFDTFTQADASIGRKFGGSGLGLAICKKIVELMGGRIGVESELGKGSTFWFEVMFDKVAYCPMPQREQVVAVAAQPCRVLLVEDNHVNQQVAQLLLQSQGHSVDVAANGIEALEMLSRLDYDLIFMDMQMPEMDGLEATRRIRQMAGPQKGLPIVAMTANAMKSDELACLEAGMNGYISKPVTVEKLQEAIKKQIEAKA